ncbi:MAG: hypothetical protein CSB28_00775 [Desulfobacterales bacterium]|nr:MAG: hypothetical protein CSB28_00775 [Desulfobacterales bacterium]
MKILIVDDEKEFANTLCQRLTLRKYEVMEAHSGKEGLTVLEESAADIVLLDLKMPDMDGLEFLAALRRKQPQTKVIMLTGHGSGEAGEQALAMGASAYLMKPVDFTELLKTVEEAASA